MQISWACWERSSLVRPAFITDSLFELKLVLLLFLQPIWNFPFTPFPLLQYNLVAMKHFPLFSMAEFVNEIVSWKKSAVLTWEFYALEQHRLGLILPFEVRLLFSQSLKWRFLWHLLGFVFKSTSIHFNSTRAPNYGGDSLCITTVAVSACKHYEAAEGYQTELSPPWVSLIKTS